VGGDHVLHHLDLAAVVGELAGGRHPRQDLQEDGNMAEIKLFLNIFEQLGDFLQKNFEPRTNLSSWNKTLCMSVYFKQRTLDN
jgi:hypothetical protein